jgi:hypothetical protein
MSGCQGEPANKKHKIGTEDFDGCACWRSTIPADISDDTTRAIEDEITAQESMKTAIRLAWTNVQKGHPANETKLATTPMKRAVFMCKTGAVVSAEFPQNNTTLSDTFTGLHLPESLAYPHPVRVCNVCYNAVKVDEAVTSYMQTQTTADGIADASATPSDVVIYIQWIKDNFVPKRFGAEPEKVVVMDSEKEDGLSHRASHVTSVVKQPEPKLKPKAVAAGSKSAKKKRDRSGSSGNVASNEGDTEQELDPGAAMKLEVKKRCKKLSISVFHSLAPYIKCDVFIEDLLKLDTYSNLQNNDNIFIIISGFWNV